LIEGYSKLESGAFNFSVQYPKSWFYAGAAGSETGVVRHYEFGSKPLDETPGQVSFDLISGSMPAGTTVSLNGKNAVTTVSSGTAEIYVKGTGSRIYRITGPSTMESTLMNMAGSIE
jgi:hypothetical protein